MIIAFYIYTCVYQYLRYLLLCLTLYLAYCRTRQTLITSQLRNKIHSVTMCGASCCRIRLTNMRQFRDLSDVVVFGRQGANSIDKIRYKVRQRNFLKSQRQLSFHECEGTSAFVSRARCLLRGKGGSIDLRGRWRIRVAAWMRFEL